MLRTIAVPLCVALSMLVASGSAHAAPPTSGTSSPLFHTPARISFGHVGPVVLLPYRNCSAREDDGQISATCPGRVSPVRRIAFVPVRTQQGVEWRATQLTIMDRVLLTKPYGRGFQWLWGARNEPVVIAASALGAAELI